MTGRIFVTAILQAILLTPTAVFAQREKTVETEYTYCAPSSMSPLQAQAEAIEKAREEALADCFGRIVASNSYIKMSTNDSQTTSLFSVVGGSEVRGEWLRDLEPPKVKHTAILDDLTLCVTVHVKGVAAEIVSAPVRYEKRILRNGTDDRNESDDFMDGDRFYMSFRSPASGYLAVYMLDDDGKAYRLLPYPSTGEAAFRVEHDKRYVLFDAQQGGDAIQAYCAKPMEFNHIYTIFSPHAFTRSLDSGVVRSDGGLLLPPELSLKEFQKWFVDIRKYDKDIAVDRQTIRIRKKQ